MPRSNILFVILALSVGCIKTDDTGIPSTGNNNSYDTAAAVTPAGTPVGAPVTQNIGASGGTIKSADGRIELIIPSGALTTTQSISIQPLTNECPNGIGDAYDFLPNGLAFLVPATLILHYTDDDADGVDPMFINLAFQDSLYQWELNIDKDVDTINKTVIFDVTHFSRRSFQAPVKVNKTWLNARRTEFHENDQGLLTVTQSFTKPQLVDDPNGGDQLSSLPTAIPIPGGNINNWALSSPDGTLSATSGNPVNYTAPSSIITDKYVTVSVRVNQSLRSRGRNGKITFKANGYETYYVKLHLLPNDMSFSVHVDFNSKNTSGVINDLYHDEATFEVDVKNGLVSFPAGKIQNQAPTATPSTGTVGKTKADWIPDTYGVVNVTGGSGYTFADSLNGNIQWVSSIITHTGTKTPSWTITDLTYGTTTQIVGSSVPGYPAALNFIKKDSVQVFDPEKGNILEGLMTVTVTPIH